MKDNKAHQKYLLVYWRFYNYILSHALGVLVRSHPVFSFFLVKGYDLHMPVADNGLTINKKARLPIPKLQEAYRLLC